MSRHRMRWPFIISIILFWSAYFACAFPGYSVPIVTTLMVVLLSLPAVLEVNRENWSLLLILSLYAYAIETIGLLTGYPYGVFVYGSAIGPKVLGFLPLLLPFAYVPLVIGVGALTRRRSLLLATICLLAVDIVIDPGAVRLGYWAYAHGDFYGVPLTNFLGWIFTGSIALFIVRQFYGRIPIAAARSLMWQLSFWTGVSVWSGLFFPAVVGIVLHIPVVYELWSERSMSFSTR